MKKLFHNLLMAGSLSLMATTTNAVTFFLDDMENGTNGWTTGGSSDGITEDGGLWHLSQRWSYGTGTTNSWYYGKESTGDVGTSGWNHGWIISPSFSITGVTNAVLTFEHRPRGDSYLPIDEDMVSLDVSTDGGTNWSNIGVGLLVGWSMWGFGGEFYDPTMSIDISQFIGETVKIRFYILTDRACGEFEDPNMCDIPEGWYIDNVRVTGNQ